MKDNTKIVIGMDQSDKKSELCVLDAESREVLERTQVLNEAEDIEGWFGRYNTPGNVLVAMESGTHSPWISALLCELGFQVVVGNSRKLRAIWDNNRKSDKKDAELLARLACNDLNLFHPIYHRSRKNQSMLMILKSRDNLVRTRVTIINQVRGMLKSLGLRITATCTPATFGEKAYKEIPKEHQFALKEQFNVLRQIDESIKNYDKQIVEISNEHYPETKRLRSIQGVGPITALAYVLIIEDPNNFKKGRDVGAYLGLVPKRDQSGEIDKRLGITKAGNPYLRRLLAQCAQSLLRSNSPDSELKRFGERLTQRGGSSGKKKAVTAVSRKLAILMHCLWKDDVDYDPFYRKNKKLKTAA